MEKWQRYGVHDFRTTCWKWLREEVVRWCGLVEDGGWREWLKVNWEGMLNMARMASLYSHLGLTRKHVQIVVQLMTWHIGNPKEI